MLVVFFCKLIDVVIGLGVEDVLFHHSRLGEDVFSGLVVPTSGGWRAIVVGGYADPVNVLVSRVVWEEGVILIEVCQWVRMVSNKVGEIYTFVLMTPSELVSISANLASPTLGVY